MTRKTVKEAERHAAMEQDLYGTEYGTQYGNHSGLDAGEALWVASPHEQIGKPKGDRNRKPGSRPQTDPFYDFVK